MDLADVLHPVAIDAFLDSHWGKSQLHIPGTTALKFESLLRCLELPAVIWRENGAWGDLSLARAGTRATDCPYLRRPASLEVIEAAFADSYTLVVNNYQTKNPEIANLCRAFEVAFFARCTVNLYQTGPNCRGLDAHYDDTDVFVLQVEGSKTWHILEGGRQDPLPNEPYHRLPGTLDLLCEYELQAGDLLYIPRGVVHEAHTKSSSSVHLTIAVSTVRWVTLLKHALQLAAQEHVELRKDAVAAGLPIGSEAIHVEAKYLASRLAHWLGEPSTVEAALSGLRHEWIDSLDRLPKSRASGIGRPPVPIGTSFAHAADQAFSLCATAGGPVLRFVGGHLELDTALAAAAEFVVSHRQFDVHEIPDLDEAQSFSLVANLVQLGLLEPR